MPSFLRKIFRNYGEKTDHQPPLDGSSSGSSGRRGRSKNRSAGVSDKSVGSSPNSSTGRRKLRGIRDRSSSRKRQQKQQQKQQQQQQQKQQTQSKNVNHQNNDALSAVSLSGNSSHSVASSGGSWSSGRAGKKDKSPKTSDIKLPPTSVVVTTSTPLSVSPPNTATTSCNNSLGGDDNSSHGGHDSLASAPSSSYKKACLRRSGSVGSHGQDSDVSGSTYKKASLMRSGSFASSVGASNSKVLAHSTSAIGLDEMIEDRREGGHLGQNVVHLEVPFGKPIEEVYDGVHNGPVLGSGISGMVRLVTHKATGIKYAVKVLDLGLLETPNGLQSLREEIFIMCQLDHPNIVRLEEVYESHTEIYLVQELCLGGELFDRLDEQPDYHYTEAECARLVKQMLSAVRYLHSKGIIHRDLKLENFLFSTMHPDADLKMIDFGLSKHFRYGEVHHEAVGTPYTVAPEVILGSYDERCDIWAIGVITFLLLSGEPPFGGCGGPEPLMKVRSNILHGRYAFEPEEIWELVTPAALLFIQSLLVTDPQKRPTAQVAQQHEWFQYWAKKNRDENDHVLNPNVVKALVGFKEFSDMRKLLCEVLSFTLLPDQIRDLRRAFEIMDTDGSGEISLCALKDVLMENAGQGSLGALTEEEVTDIFDAMRVRKTETRIHWHEFIAAGLSQCAVDDRNLRLAFDRLDSDHKGYITLDDIMDLMGSDALQSEEAMRRMWIDSMKSIKCQYARVTYDDFLLLMKGQTKDHPQDNLRQPNVAAAPDLGSLRNLNLVPEGIPVEHGEPVTSPAIATTPIRPIFHHNSHSAPTTPAHHKKIISMDEDEFDSPLSMDDEMPPQELTMELMTPVLENMDSVSPLKTDEKHLYQGSNLLIPEFNTPDSGIRRRSKSLGEDHDDPDKHYRSGTVVASGSTEVSDSSGDLGVVADTVRDLLLPETDHGSHAVLNLDEVVKDKSKSALVVNRCLYRAHRQMRLAVLEASKRFEEQQEKYAKEVILAQRELEQQIVGDPHVFHAGLVMRHGHTKQVSSEAIRAMLAQDRAEQDQLVDKATIRGGRGRRSRKKTISDMSGMISALNTEDLALAMVPSVTLSDNIAESPNSSMFDNVNDDTFGNVSEPAAKKPEACEAVEPFNGTSTSGKPPRNPSKTNGVKDVSVNSAPKEGPMRAATVPGEFRQTSDPFGREGKYRSIISWKP